MALQHKPKSLGASGAAKWRSRWITVLAALALVMTSLSGCGYQVYDYSPYAPGFMPVIKGATSGAPGQEVTRSLEVEGDFDGGRVVYYPPRGAMDLEVDGAQPQPGGPPYVFESVSAGAFATVTYSLPPLLTSETQKRVLDGMAAYTAGGDLSTAYLETMVTRASSAAQFEAQPAAHLPGSRRYEIQQTYNDSTTVLTSAACQSWADEIQQGRMFKAVLAPLQPPNPEESSLSPAAYPAASAPRWSIVDQHGQPEKTLAGGSLAFDLAMSARMGDRLPADPGEVWLVFRPQAEPAVTCPGGINVEAGKWSLVTQISLNIEDAPVRVPSYTCFEGDVPPAFMGGTGPAAALTSTVRENGVTCLGPETVELGRQPDFELTGGSWQVVTPPARVQFRHYINPLSGPVKVNVTLSSTLDVPWLLYNSNGVDTRPVMANPVALPLEVSRYKNVWAVANLPADTPPGPYQLNFTVTSEDDPSQSYTITDLLWVGAWEAPKPTAPPAPPLARQSQPWIEPGKAVTISWQAGEGPTPLQYELRVNGETIMTGSRTSYTLTLPEGTHRWSVRAVNDGGASPWSIFSIVVGNPHLYIPLVWK